MKKYFIFVCVFLICVISLYSVSAVLPEEYSNSAISFNFYDCKAFCSKAFSSCDLSCLGNKLDCDYSTIECANAGRRAYGACSGGCIERSNACLESCYVVAYGSGKDVPSDQFRELEVKQGCEVSEASADGCCPGYLVSEFGFCCKEGFEGVNNNGVYSCEPVSREEGKIALNLKESDFEEGVLKGVLKFSCSGECEGKVATISVSDDGKRKVNYEVSYSTDKPYLSNENNEIGFVVSFDPAEFKRSKSKVIILSSGDLELKRVVAPDYPFDFYIEILGDEPISEGEYVKFKVSVEGVDEGEEYVYMIDSVRGKHYRSNFYYGGEDYPVSALITDAPSEIVVTWQVPVLSTPISVETMYATEIPELVEGQAKSVVRALINKIGGKYLKGKGVDNADELLLLQDTAISAGQDGWWPATKSYLDDYGLAIDLTEKYYEAYRKANERMERWDSEELHIYDVPVTVVVKSPSGDILTKKKTVQVEAANVRFV